MTLDMMLMMMLMDGLDDVKKMSNPKSHLSPRFSTAHFSSTLPPTSTLK